VKFWNDKWSAYDLSLLFYVENQVLLLQKFPIFATNICSESKAHANLRRTTLHLRRPWPTQIQNILLYLRRPLLLVCICGGQKAHANNRWKKIKISNICRNNGGRKFCIKNCHIVVVTNQR